MDPLDEVELIEGKGLVDDANRSRFRQVTLIEQEKWAAAEQQLGLQIDPAARRANLLIRGVALERTRGRRLAIGSTIIEIRGETVPCERMDEAAEGLQAALRPDWRGGAFGQVVRGGKIRVGDPVRWVSGD